MGKSPAASAAEMLDRQRFRTQSEARMAVFDFIEGSHKPWRRHSALGYLSLIGFER
jgi:putative transposase